MPFTKDLAGWSVAKISDMLQSDSDKTLHPCPIIHMTPGDSTLMIDPASNKLAQLLISRRIELGHQNRAGFARHHELNSGQQRTIEDMENARRINYRASTKAFVEHIYQWAPGSIDAVLEDGEPTPVETATRPATSHITDEPDSSDRFKNFISKIPPAVADLPLDEQQRLIEEIWSAIRRHNA